MFSCIFNVSLCQWGILFYIFRNNIHKLNLLHILNCCNDIHVSYGLFIHVFKCTYFTIWNKIYVRACTWNLRLMFSDIKCIRVFILFGTCTLSRLKGRGSLITFRSKKRGGGRRVGQLLTGFKRILHVLTHTRAVVGS